MNNIPLNLTPVPQIQPPNDNVIARSDGTGRELTDGVKPNNYPSVHVDPGMVFWQENPNPDGNFIWNGPFPNVTFDLHGVYSALNSVELYYGGFVDLQGPQGMNISFSLDDATYTAPTLYNSAPQGYPNNLNMAYHTATEPLGYSASDFRYVNVEFIPSANPVNGTGFLTMGEVTFDGIFESVVTEPYPFLGRGHRVLLENGLQIKATAQPVETGSFDTALWAESNFTTVRLSGSGPDADLQFALMPPAPGIPWGTGANMSPYIYPYLTASAYPYQSSLISVQVTDERLIGPASDPEIALRLDNMKTAFETIRNLNLNVMVYANNQPQTDEDMRYYMQYTKPDMLHTGGFPFQGHGWTLGGSPASLYESLEQYRKLGLEGNDGTGTEPIPVGLYTQTFVWAEHTVSESEIRLDNFAAWAFGVKSVEAYFYDSWPDDPGGNPPLQPIMFTGPGTNVPTNKFYQVAETNRQSLNLGPALIRLISTDLRMKMGRHQDEFGVPVTNDRPGAGTGTLSEVSAWDSAADPYITSIAATNLGLANNALEGDVIVGYFKPLDPSFTNPGHEDDIYFMIVNGLSYEYESYYDCQQEIHIEFDFVDSGITSLQRLSRDMGLVEEVSLVHTSGSLYYLDLTLDGGTGDLFKFNNGGTFVLEPTTIGLLPGDFDNDGDVDGVDFLAWQTGYYTAAGALRGDGDSDNDGDVDGVDFLAWQTGYPTNVNPELATLGLLLLGGLALLRREGKH